MSTMQSSSYRMIVVVTAGCGVVATVALLFRWSGRRGRQPAAAGLAVAAQRAEEEEDHCAICLEVPSHPCRTSCGHRFCVHCFRSWAERQVPHTPAARCPLCITPVVSLHAEFGSLGSTERGWVWHYNLLARRETQQLRKLVDGVRFAMGKSALALYVFSGHCWEEAQDAMRPSFAPLPRASDTRLRAVCRWLLSAHLLSVVQRFLHPDDPRHEGVAELLAKLRPFALLVIAFARDARHTLFELGRDRTAHEVMLCRSTHFVGLACRLARSVLRAMPAAQPDVAAAAAWRYPLLARMLDVAVVLAELCACASHLRLEVAGVRGLLLLLSWRDACGSRLAYKCAPHESGLFSRRYCEIEEFDATQNLFIARRGLAWADALREFAIPLRALAAFRSTRELTQIFGLPLWAVHDIRLIRDAYPGGGGPVGGGEGEMTI